MIKRKTGKTMAENDKNNGTSSDFLWVPLRSDEVTPETMKVINSVLQEIPELPHSVHRVLELSSDEESDLGEIVDLLSFDPVLVSKILKVVNSSYYGLSHKTDNLHLAVVLLGFKELQKIVISSYVNGMFGKTGTIYDTRQLWEHSYLVSICAESFVAEEKPQLRGVYLTLGLLHDIGKFTLYEISSVMEKKGKKPEYNEKLSESGYLLEKEEKLFGINHAVVGGILAKKWNLPERIISVLECHHYPSFFGISEIPSEYEEEISAICISDLIINKFMNEKNILPEPHLHFFDVLGFTPPAESIITEEMKEKFEKAKEYMVIFE